MYVPGGSVAAVPVALCPALAPPCTWPELRAREHPAWVTAAIAAMVTRSRGESRDMSFSVASPVCRPESKRLIVKRAHMGKKLELAIAILNGAVGDRLARTDNGLATSMACFTAGRALPMTRAEIARAHPAATPRVAILVHGLMCTEDVWTLPDGTDYGSLLARDRGFTPLYLRYNTGLKISDNGEAFPGCSMGSWPSIRWPSTQARSWWRRWRRRIQLSFRGPKRGQRVMDRSV